MVWAREPRMPVTRAIQVVLATWTLVSWCVSSYAISRSLDCALQLQSIIACQGQLAMAWGQR